MVPPVFGAVGKLSLITNSSLMATVPAAWLQVMVTVLPEPTCSYTTVPVLAWVVVFSFMVIATAAVALCISAEVDLTWILTPSSEPSTKEPLIYFSR